MISLRCVQPFPCEITWNGARSSMPPSERSAIVSEKPLSPSVSSRFPSRACYLSYYDNHATYITFEDPSIAYRFGCGYGVIDPSKLEPTFYDPKGTLHPGYVIPPDSDFPYERVVPDSYATETTFIYDSIFLPFDSSQLVATWPNRFHHEGDWFVPAFQSTPGKVSFAVAHVPSFPFFFAAHLTKLSSVSRLPDGSLDLSNASEVWFKFLDNLIYTPPFLLGYEITFQNPTEYSIESKVWNRDLLSPEDDQASSFIHNISVPLPVDERDDDWRYFPFHSDVFNVRSDFIHYFTSALDKVKPEVTFLDRPQQPHLYNIANPCT